MERRAPASAPLQAIDRLIPAALLQTHEGRLRSRVLVVTSLGIGALVLLGMTIRAMTLPLDPNFWIGVTLVVVLLALPGIQRLTGSARLAGGIFSGLLLTAMPLVLVRFGGFPAPALLLFPAIPVITTFFNGLWVGLLSVLVLGGATIFAASTQPPLQEALTRDATPTMAAFAALSPAIAFLLAAVYDRNRQRNEDELGAINQALVEARARAEGADLRKTEFLRHMSHELRTPLNAIIGYAELIREELAERADAELAEDAAKIEGASRHLLGLINDLLDLSKIEAGAIDLRPEAVDLPALLEDLRGTIAPLAARRGNTLAVTAAGDLGAIEADRQRLSQILLNLAGNACKFTERGAIEIRAGWLDPGARVRLQVTDTGVGMSAEELARIFEPFVQVDESASRRREGSGLGLAITKQLVEVMGGALTVESTRGVGSTFSVDLPARPLRAS